MRDDEVYLRHIRDAIQSITEYTTGGREQFFRHKIVQDAVVRNLEIIGEAVKNLFPRFALPPSRRALATDRRTSGRVDSSVLRRQYGVGLAGGRASTAGTLTAGSTPYREGWMNKDRPPLSSRDPQNRILTRYSSTALPSAGTLTCQTAVRASSLTWGWVWPTISQSPGTGSATLTVTSSFLAFLSSMR